MKKIVNSNNDILKLFRSEVDLRVYCPHCKHGNTMPVQMDEKICYWCHRKIKNNTKTYFKYKLKKLGEMKNEKN